LVIAAPPLYVGAEKATLNVPSPQMISVMVGADATTPIMLAVNFGCVIE
jgi:hypothetical protein